MAKNSSKASGRYGEVSTPQSRTLELAKFGSEAMQRMAGLSTAAVTVSPSKSDSQKRKAANGAPDTAVGIALARDLLSELREWRAEPLHRIFIHKAFFEFGDGEIIGDGPFARRANLVLQHLAAHGRTSVVKGVRGNSNQGWRRTPFGGNAGSHFYGWWAPSDASPVRSLGLPEKSIVVRAIRHHDDHTPLTADTVDSYEELVPARIIEGEDLHLPWTETQLQFSTSEEPVRVLIGYPGTGKTTTLWDAVIRRSGENVLYLTWSGRLAEMASEFFQSFAPQDMTVTTRSFTELLNGILGSVPTSHDRSIAGERASFQKAMANVPPAELGEWKGKHDALMTELRAHLVGGALPHEPKHLAEPERCRLRDSRYIELRGPVIGKEAAERVVRVANLIEKQGRNIEELFPELDRAFQAGRRVMSNKNVLKGERTKWLLADRIVVDEVQDLTPVEMAVPVLLARRLADEREGRPPFLLCAGDEGQTVRPTDFEWPAFKSLVTSLISAPEQTQLETSLRYPRNIAALVNNTRELYTELEKFDRPRYQARVATKDTIRDEIIHCVAEQDDPELVRLIAEIARTPGTALVGFSPDLLSGVPEDIRPQVLFPSEAKGCEYQAVCLLNPSAYLNRMLADAESAASSLERFWLRTAIDTFRVALSRATETLILLDGHREGRAGTQRLDRLFSGLRPMVMTPAEAFMHLQASNDLSVDEYLQKSIEEARGMVQVNPSIAVGRARNAVLQLGTRDVPGSVTDPALRREVHECLVGVAWEVTASPTNLPAGESEASLLRLARASAMELDTLAVEDATEAGRDIGSDNDGSNGAPLRRWQAAAKLFEAAEGLAVAMEVDRGEALAGLFDSIEALPGEDHWIRAGLMPRVDRLLKLAEDAARDVRTADETGLAYYDWLKALVGHAGLEGMDPVPVANRLSCIAAETMVKASRPREALDILECCTETPPLLMARVHEGLKDWTEASKSFEEAGDLEEALRCARRGVRIDRAINLAKQLENHKALATLQWLKRVEAVAREKPSDLRRGLEDEERQWALDRLKDAQLL